MRSSHPSSTSGRIVRVYRKALCLYPTAYRTRFALEMEQVFREQWREVHGRGSSLEACGFLFWTAGELLFTSCREQVAALRKARTMKPAPTAFTHVGWSLAGGLLVSAVILSLVIGITLAMPKTYMSSTKVLLRWIVDSRIPPSDPPDPLPLQTALAAIRSPEVLGKAAERARLAEHWSPGYLRTGTLQPAEIVEILKDHLEVRQFRNTPIAEIRVYDKDRQLAADIANAVAQSYLESRVTGPDSPRNAASVVDLAEPGLRPVRPNLPLNVCVGLLTGGTLGAVTAGGLWLLLRRRSRATASPSAV